MKPTVNTENVKIDFESALVVCNLLNSNDLFVLRKSGEIDQTKERSIELWEKIFEKILTKKVKG